MASTISDQSKLNSTIHAFNEPQETELALLNKIALEMQQIHVEICQLQNTVIDIQQQLLDIDAAVKTAGLRWISSKIKNRLPFKLKIGHLNQHAPKPFCMNPKSYRKKIKLENPLTISIVTPSYNQGQFLEKTILSVLSQNYPALQYIIQDGGSTDNSVQILKTYEHTLKHWESMKDNGQSQAINLGFNHATGDIMAYLNSDDVLMGGALHTVAKYFSDHPKVDVVYGHRVIINESDQEIGRWVLPPHDNAVLAWADFIPQETLFWRRRIWEKAGGHIDESFRFAMDWDLLLRFKEAGATFARLPRFLGAFRVHSQQKTSADMHVIGTNEMNRLRFRHHGRPISHYEIKRQIKRYELKHLFCHYLYKMGLLRY